MEFSDQQLPGFLISTFQDRVSRSTNNIMPKKEKKDKSSKKTRREKKRKRDDPDSSDDEDRGTKRVQKEARAYS